MEIETRGRNPEEEIEQDFKGAGNAGSWQENALQSNCTTANDNKNIEELAEMGSVVTPSLGWDSVTEVAADQVVKNITEGGNSCRNLKESALDVEKNSAPLPADNLQSNATTSNDGKGDDAIEMESVVTSSESFVVESMGDVTGQEKNIDLGPNEFCSGKLTIKWAETGTEMDNILKEYMKKTSSKFTSWKITKGFLREVTDIKKYKVSFEDAKVKTRPEQQIKYTSVPFIIVGQKIYECEFGVDRNVTTKKKLLDLKAVEMLRKLSGQEDLDIPGDPKSVRRRGPRFCKKFGCPVKIVMRDVIFFPEYKAKGNTEKYKRKVTKALSQDWVDSKKIVMKRKILIPLPNPDQHQNHPPQPERHTRRRRNRRKNKDAESGNGVTDDIDDYGASGTEEDTEEKEPFTMRKNYPNRNIPIWSRCMLSIVKKLNNFHQTGSSKELCRPFIVNNTQCGIVPLPVLSELQSYQDTFRFVKDEKTDNIKFVTFVDELKTAEQRTFAVEIVTRAFRLKNLFSTLNGWRDELYAVTSSFGGEPLFEIERAASCLFGVHQYGVHMNGFVRNAQNEIFLWIGKRSDTKPTWPGKLDNTVGGGISSGMTVQGTLIKECLEEAAIPEELVRHARPAGTVSYTYEDERGIFPETQFVFDLEMPESFQPVNIDGEVQAFYLLTIEEVKTLIATDEFKPNCAMIILDFLIRHGFIDPNSEPYYVDLIKGIHS